MTKRNQKIETVVTFRDIATSFDQASVDATIAAISESFVRRDAFELSQGLSLTEKNSYTVERKRMTNASVAVARFMLALNVEPSTVIERKVSSNAMFNAKALKKVTELAQFAVGHGAKIERVMRAFIACALVATAKGHDVITNSINARFLNSDDLKNYVSDQDLLDNLNDLRATHMSSGAATQSSQARNVLDVLGLGAIRTVDKSRDAIALHADAPFFADFKQAFMK